MKPFLKINITATVILIICFFGILNLTGLSKPVRNFIYSISAPIQENFWQKGNKVSDFFDFISRSKSLGEENKKLLSDNQELISENTWLKELKKENEMLRQALDIELQKDFKLILAEIISKDISQDFILINKGLKHGILKGRAVVTSQKALCGRIDEVYDDFSKVMLISNPEISFDAKIQSEDKDEVYGVIEGKTNSALYFNLIPQDKEIKKHDIIITTSLGGIFPKGLLVGRIKEIKQDDVQPFQQAEIEPFFSLKDIETLFIITEY
ncbi:rod shape-determining protein MreC [Candidatus Parcubacteria bacterium]|nr:rod shape-determining protein MreC [Candidatus Parcubacteria bacterium]